MPSPSFLPVVLLTIAVWLPTSAVSAQRPSFPPTSSGPLVASLVTIVGPGSSFTFDAPRGLLGRMRVSEGVSPVQSVVEWPVAGYGASVRMTLLSTNWDDDGGLYSEGDFDRYFYQGLRPTLRTKTRAGRLVASGFKDDGRIYYRQGGYTAMASMEGRESGPPTWLWSRSWILEFIYPEERREEFDRLIPLMTRSLDVSFIW